MADLKTSIGKLRLKNPVIAASGTFGHGEEFSRIFDINRLGGIVTKTITLNPKTGNPPPRVAETECGMLNAIGLQNRGLEDFLKNKAPFLRGLKTAVIVSVSADTPAEFARLSAAVEGSGAADAVELNLSCPNIFHERPRMVSQDAAATAAVIKAVKKRIGLPLIAKLSPNVTDIREIAAAAEKSGADALTLINCMPGMAVSLKTQKPLLGNVSGGYSGPALKPIALKTVWDVHNTVSIPIIGVGGIRTAEDALEFILCGARAVQVGTANFITPDICIEIIDGISEYADRNGMKHPKQLEGKLKI